MDLEIIVPFGLGAVIKTQNSHRIETILEQPSRDSF